VGGQPKVVYPVSMKPRQGKAADFEKRGDMWKMMLQVKAPVAETARGSVPGGNSVGERPGLQSYGGAKPGFGQ
jgi:hypothetical protein